MADAQLHIIARIHTDLPSKFGVPRQSGLVGALRGEIVFEPPYRSAEAVRGLEEFSHLWLIWQFSMALRDQWSPTVRPPRLGGNRRVGVFATRSPFRPNSLGLSAVHLDEISFDGVNGPVLHVSGVDLADGTPIFDIKPYLPYADCRPDAAGGFTDAVPRVLLRVEADAALLSRIPPDKREALLGVLENDPRPAYQSSPDRVYGFPFAGYEVRFRVSGGVLTVVDVTEGEK